MKRPLLSATLIARNERQNVRRCLASLWPHVDEVVIVDTGSSDGTLGEALRFAKERRQVSKLKTARFKWCDDFAAARNAADELATGEWLVWADLDDEIRGLDRLRAMCTDADDGVVGFFVRYSYARDADNNTISELWRERVVRNDGTRWQGRLHEHKLFTQGTVIKVDEQIAEWVHRRDHEQRTAERNLRILKAWDRDEPDNPRIVVSLAMELMGDGQHKEASDAFARYLSLDGEPADRRAQATRHMCVMLMLQERVQEARDAALDSLRETWTWADTHLTLAEAEQTLGRPDVGLVHAQTALGLGQPETLLIINPLQYTAHPRALLAVCLAQMGRFDEAVQQADECLRIAPSYQLITANLPLWRGQLKKQHARDAFLACERVLTEAGELVKARELLERAPWYIVDDGELVGRRAALSREISDRVGRETTVPAEPDEAADAFFERHEAAAA